MQPLYSYTDTRLNEIPSLHDLKIWLDYSDAANEGKWVDRNNNEERYIAWEDGQPNGDDYAMMNYHASKPTKVYDRPNKDLADTLLCVIDFNERE